MTENNGQCDVQRQKRKTDHHAIGNEWQYATVNVEDKKRNMNTPRNDNL